MRYRALYGIELRDYRNYDLVVDTSYVSPQTVADVIEKGFRVHHDSLPHPQLWMSPKRLAGLPKVEAGTVELTMDSVGLTAREGSFHVASGDVIIAAAIRDGTTLLPARLA